VNRLEKSIYPLEHRPRLIALQGIGAQRGAKLSHERCCPHAVARDVPDRDSNLPRSELDDVVPVSSNLVTRREVAGGDRHADRLRQSPWEEAPLKHHRASVLPLERIEQV
jgi:hypothetical protein